MNINERLAPYLQRIAAIAGEDYTSLYYYIIMETGELAEEFFKGRNNLPPGEDGVDGELVDIFIAIYGYSRDFTFSQNSSRYRCLDVITEVLHCETRQSMQDAMNNILHHFIFHEKLEWFFEYLDKKITKWENKDAAQGN